MTLVDPVNDEGVVSGRGANGFYTQVATTDDWVEIDIGFTSGSQILICTVANADISYSNAGGLNRGGPKPVQLVVLGGETFTFNMRYTSKLYCRSTTPATPATLRIVAW